MTVVEGLVRMTEDDPGKRTQAGGLGFFATRTFFQEVATLGVGDAIGTRRTTIGGTKFEAPGALVDAAIVVATVLKTVDAGNVFPKMLGGLVTVLMATESPDVIILRATRVLQALGTSTLGATMIGGTEMMSHIRRSKRTTLKSQTLVGFRTTIFSLIPMLPLEATCGISFTP